MSKEKINIDTEDSKKDLSKGERLRLAREAMKLQASDVAAKLYFETRFILALENNDYSVFAGSAYLYGYMRAYVKLLNLPLEEFVSDLQNIEDENDFHFENVDENLDYQTAAQTKHRNWILPVIITGVLVAVVVGFFLMSGEDLARAESSKWQADSSIQLSQESQRLSVIANEDVDDARTAEKINIELAITSTTNGDNTQQVAEPTASTSRLLLEYKTDSWTDIRDANGKRLVYRMVEKGNRLQLDSSPTYSVLLGYSPGVSVSLNDQPVNISEYERENIAYFKVGDKNKASSMALGQE